MENDRVTSLQAVLDQLMSARLMLNSISKVCKQEKVRRVGGLEGWRVRGLEG